MDKRILQSYSVWAKENLEQQVEISLKTLGINSEKDIANARKVGDVTTIEGDPNSYSADLYDKRSKIISLVKSEGYKNVIEEFAYTWFNRFVALRFMEVHDFLPHGFRVLSNRSGGIEPEILSNLSFVKDDLHLDLEYCGRLRDQNRVEELFRYVLLQQCNSLADILPMLFSHDLVYLELMLPRTLLRGDTAITKLLEIPEEAFLEDAETIGWMYQFYISSKKDAVNKAKKIITKDTLPAVTQLFTPDWIVRYMAENSVGRIWLESYPSSSLKHQMKYYVDDAEQAEEVQKKLDEIKYKNVNPEEIKIIEPCCGSGHILVYVFDLLYKMYEEKGYAAREIPTLILSNNLYGLDVDKRAAQLASFALVMKARNFNNRFFSPNYFALPNVFEIIDSTRLIQMRYDKHLADLNILSDSELKEIDKLVDLFKNGKTIGSLLKIRNVDLKQVENALNVVKQNAISNIFNSEFLEDGIKELNYILNLARILSSKYDVMITNPPYIGISSMEDAVKEYAVKNYPNSKTDMFAMFMETEYVKKNGFTAMINMHSWMFLSSYEELRNFMLSKSTIVSMIHLGARAFDAIPGEVVQTTAFVIRNNSISDYKAPYFRLVDLPNELSKLDTFVQKNNSKVYYCVKQSSFNNIPGKPIAYWASQNVYNAFKEGENIQKYGTSFQGIITGNNNKFLRLWYELEFKKIALNYEKIEDVKLSETYWIPYNKGGEYRKWYGNQDYVVYWKNGSRDKTRGKEQFSNYYLKEYFSWSYIATNSLATRRFPKGFLWDVAGSGLFATRKNSLYLQGALGSKVGLYILNTINPTINFQVENILVFPVIFDREKENTIDYLIEEAVELSKIDWDSFETSWYFKEHPLVRLSKELWDSTAISATMFKYYGKQIKVNSSLELCFMLWQGECQDRFNKLKANEEELNRIFIDIYGLQDELTPEVEDKDVTVRLADKERDIKSLISYLVGIVMGRYSLSKDGLVYAGGEWNEANYFAYKPDKDGIVPIYSSLGMEDGLTSKIIELVKKIFGEKDYRNNIDFIAEALGKKQNESSEETLNRYLNDGFYSDHLKIYQKRPIYWMLSSGKNSGFKCLIYMHRYNSDTLAAINGKYFLPESTRIKNELEEVNSSIAASEGRERIRLEKERQKLATKYNEAIEYGLVLDHMANKYIEIDLDDGVKVNYEKFQGVELVSDNGTKIKKDLLVPIK